MLREMVPAFPEPKCVAMEIATKPHSEVSRWHLMFGRAPSNNGQLLEFYTDWVELLEDLKRLFNKDITPRTRLNMHWVC